MELSDRKKAILRAIIQTYLETGEPVGSRTISKCSDLNLSSATIRNEMADLEEMGLIVQPHTSAGRIPSDRGYRLYVDDMMAEKEKEVSDMKEMLIQRVDRVELLLKQLAQLLATNTNYTAMIAGPRSSHNKVKYLQLSRVEADKLLAVVVVEGNIVKNTILDIEESLSDDALLQLNVLLNTSLAGKSLDDINLNLISEMKAQAGEYSEIVAVTLEALAKFMPKFAPRFVLLKIPAVFEIELETAFPTVFDIELFTAFDTELLIAFAVLFDKFSVMPFVTASEKEVPVDSVVVLLVPEEVPVVEPLELPVP